MKVLARKMYRNKSLTMKFLLGLMVAGCFLPMQVGAQITYDIHSFVSCLNSITSANATVVDAAAACVPSFGCYYTNTMSEESAQNACTLRDGTRLPRVIFSCTGSGGNQTLRFRPSFSLCTLGNDFTSSVINHIELGEDVNSRHVQKMADIASPPEVASFQILSEFGTGPTAVLDTLVPANNKGCSNCHDHLGTVAAGSNVVNLFAKVLPALAEGTIDTNDPSVVKPAHPVPLSEICAGIANSTQLAKNPSKKTLAVKLCNALLAKQQ